MMFIIMTCILLKLCGNNGYAVQAETNLLQMKVEGIIQKYIKPIQQLQAKFPEHGIEIQLELSENNVPVTHIPVRVSLAARPRLYRRLNYAHLLNPPKPIVNAKPDPIHDVTLPLLRQGNNETALMTTDASTKASTTDKDKRPVNIEDLKKALNDFEKKIISSTAMKDADNSSIVEEGKQPLLKKDLWMALECTGGHKHHPVENHNNLDENEMKNIQNQETSTSLFPNNNNNNIDLIHQLLKRGIRIQKSAPKSSENNLHWYQVKVPKLFK